MLLVAKVFIYYSSQPPVEGEKIYRVLARGWRARGRGTLDGSSDGVGTVGPQGGH